jgi:hypothetical protein
MPEMSELACNGGYVVQFAALIPYTEIEDKESELFDISAV